VTGVRPTGRGLLVIAGAAICYTVGWAFGTRELAVLALVLALSVVLAAAGVWLARRTPRQMLRRLPPRASAGQPLEAEVQIGPVPRLVSAALVERCRGLGDPSALLAQREHRLEGIWRVDDPPRGRFRLEPELVLEDVLGLVRARVPLAAPARVRVEPVLVELGPARSRAFAQRDGTRHAFASNAGDGLAGVRDHEVGESLRRVHWRTTARRGRLTVRELEEHPREQLHVLLDAAARGGAALRSPAFERAVQAAGSLAVHAARCGIAVSFESRGSHEQRVEVTSGRSAALVDALSSVEADGRSPLAEQLARPPAGRLCVVTSDLGPVVVERLRGLRARRRPVTVVAIDAASWDGVGGTLDANAAVLARAGIDVVVVGRDDDLARRLSPLIANGVAGAA
jgi:uncharacterized protein (DUF58 family)